MWNPQSAASATVLVADDDEASRTFVKRVLGAEGYRVLEAADGDSALESGRGSPEPADLLIVDVVMPGLRSAELAALLRERNPDLQVLFISGFTGDVLLEQGILPDHLEFMPKPFTAPTLLHKVRHMLLSVS
jgi:CheY-like chemotaxis protein